MRFSAVLVSLALHGALVIGALGWAPTDRGQTVIAVAVRGHAPPPPPEPPRPPPPPPDPAPTPAVRPHPRTRATRAVAPPSAPTQPVDVAAPPSEGFAVDMANTAAQSIVAVPAVAGGGNALADPADRTRAPGRSGGPPAGTAAGEGEATAPAAEVTELPVFLGTEADRRPPYPESARGAGVEGRVVMRVYVGVEGRVERVQILQRLEPACDVVAVRWARERWRFKPATAGGVPVPVWIEAAVSFVLER